MATTKWVIDPTHSEIGFKVKHMMFTNVSGKFDKYEATVETNGDDLTNSKIEFTAETGSVNTGDASRDAHLKTADFFDPEKFPQLKFVSTRFEKTANGEFELQGQLTMHDITKLVKLSVEYGGLMKDPWGNIKAAFSVTGKFNRKDWGLNWNAALEAGGLLVSEEVRINCEIQLVKQVLVEA
ncbi:MAG: YceI family protein [Bacteroidia bacterium]